MRVFCCYTIFMKKIWTNPAVAGVSNALVPGLGYLLIDERKVFGWLLLAGSIFCLILSFIEPAFLEQAFLVSRTAYGMTLELAWYACFVAAYGYDAYTLAKAKQPDLHPMITPSE